MNVILIILDSLWAAHMGCCGNTDIARQQHAFDAEARKAGISTSSALPM
jgi:hypothetical protein